MRRGAVAGLAVALAAALVGCGDDADQVTTDATDREQLELVYAMDEGLPADKAAQVKDTLERRIDALGIEDASVVVGDGEVVVTISPSADVDVADVSEILGDRAELRFRPVLLALPVAAAAAQAETPAEEDLPDSVVWLDGETSEDPTRYQLGPATVTGSIIESATAQLDRYGAWTVALVLTPEGIEQFNATAADCFSRSATCPTGQLAIVLDGDVASAPTIQTAAFERDAIQISGQFTEDDVKALALVLRYGALPTSLTLQSTSP